MISNLDTYFGISKNIEEKGQGKVSSAIAKCTLFNSSLLLNETMRHAINIVTLGKLLCSYIFFYNIENNNIH